MSLRAKTEYWTKWLLQESDTYTYTSVVHEIFERLWLSAERFDESDNHECVTLYLKSYIKDMTYLIHLSLSMLYIV